MTCHPERRCSQLYREHRSRRACPEQRKDSCAELFPSLQKTSAKRKAFRPLDGQGHWLQSFAIMTTEAIELIRICRLGQNAEAKTAQNNREYVVLNIATQESWKNDKRDHENRTEWGASMPGGISRSSLKRSRRGSSSPLKALCGIARSKMTLRALRSNTA